MTLIMLTTFPFTKYAARFTCKGFEGFYRATPCISAVLAVGWCLSVCHTRVLYPNGLPCWTIQRVTPSAGALN